MRASPCRARRGGWASTATSSARWGSPRGGGVRGDGRPGRPLAPGQARDARSARSATRSSSTATRGSSPATASCSPTPYWSQRRNNHSDIASLLVANAITGAASLFRRELLATRCRSRPAVRPLPRPLARPHGAGARARSPSSTGRSTTTSSTATRCSVTPRPTGCRACASRCGGLRRALRERVRRWRLTTSSTAAAWSSSPTVLELRCGGGCRRAQAPRGRPVHARRPLVLRARRARAARGARACGQAGDAGRRARLFFAFAWRRPRGDLGPRPRAPPARLRLDASAHRARPGAGPHRPRAEHRTVAEKIAPLELACATTRPRRVNLLIPTIDLEHFFGGYIAKLNLARRPGRARRAGADRDRGPGRRRCRRPGGGRSSPTAAWPASSTSVEVVFGRESQGIEVSRSDAFIATHLVDRPHRASRAAPAGRRALPLPDPGVRAVHVPDGQPTRRSPAESYRFPHHALFSSELLRDYFREHGARGLCGGRGRRRRVSARSRTRSPRRAAARRRAGGEGTRGCSSTRGRSRTPRATCSSSGRAGAGARGRGRRLATAGSCTGSAPSSAADGSASAGRPCSSCSRARPRRTTRTSCATTTSAWR